MSRYTIEITEPAEQDLHEIGRYIALMEPRKLKNMKLYELCPWLETLAPKIIEEIGEIYRFHSGCIAGIDTPPYQSETINMANHHISKKGSSHFRRTGYEIMQC